MSPQLSDGVLRSHSGRVLLQRQQSLTIVGERKIVCAPMITIKTTSLAHTSSSGCSVLVKRNVLKQGKYGMWKSYNVRCLASERRGFGSEPVKKEKSNNSKKNLKERKRSGPEPKPLSGEPKTKGRQAPELSGSIDKNSSNAVFDRQFMEKLEAVRRSALEQKKAEENKFTQAIDYDAPVESDKTTIGLGTKVGVGIAVVAFGLVFALGDFLPFGSVAPNEGTTVVGKQLTEDEKSTLQARLQQYEATLGTSPEDPTALEGAAVTLVELGEYERASSLLEKLIKESPSNTEALRLLGDVKYELKDYEGSALAYKMALSASDSVDFEVLRGLTSSLLASKKPDEAVQVLLSTREKLRSGNVSGPNVLSDANGDVDEKKQSVDPIQGREQDSCSTTEVELLLGKAYSDWGHVSDAVSVYDQLISSYPNDFRGYLAKGIILKENGKVGDAERMFIQAKFFAPEKAKALVDRYSGQ